MQNTMKVLAQVAGELTVMVQPPEGRPPKGDEAGAMFLLHPREFAYGGGVVGGWAPVFTVFLEEGKLPQLLGNSDAPIICIHQDESFALGDDRRQLPGHQVELVRPGLALPLFAINGNALA